jgi:DNA-binding SARP family transcriptional activator/tetratricopeptide (TPR) repeat protein
MTIEFRLLGQVEADIDGRSVDLGHARQRCVLAALLIDAGKVVPAEVLLDRVWAQRPPHRARTTLSSYLSRLRQILSAAPDVALTRQSGGYRLAVAPLAVDLHRFRHLVTRAGTTDRSDAAALLAEALGLWRGEPFATLDTPWLVDVRAALHAERLAAELDRNDLALARGEHAALLAELSAGAETHPLDERLAGQLMLALYRSGRQADALHHYDQLRLRLAGELGTDPSPPLSALHRQILTADPVLTGITRTSGTARATGRPVPRQLPAPPGSLNGRVCELNHLDALLDRAGGDAPTTVVISAVSGTAGVGKTALALHWAHRVAERFRDGQLHVNLRGFDPGGSMMSPAEAVRRFLDALEVPPQRIPDDLDAQAALYRSRLAGRRMLIVLDNARDAEQVRPLLPGTAGCLVLVTSRNQLTGLIAGEGAHPLTLDVLPPAAAREMFADRVGAGRVAAEPAAVDEIIIRCARLPLALAVAAARAATRPSFPLHNVAAELRDTRRRLDLLADTDPLTDVRQVFSWSYRTLNSGAARLFRLLGLHPGADIAGPAAASLAALPIDQVRPLLAELCRAHLITEHLPGRYTLHDLLRGYAAEQAHSHETGASRRTARHRVLDHYLHTGHAAARQLDPHRPDPIGDAPAEAGVTPEHPDDYDQAMAWFTAEQPVLLAAVDLAAREGFEPYTWLLAWTMVQYLDRRGHWHLLDTAYRTALDAARRVADRSGQALAHRGLGNNHIVLGQHDPATTHLERALELYEELDEPANQALTHRNIAMALEIQGRFAEALDHAQRALDRYRAAGDRAAQVRALNSVGLRHAQLGDHRQAITYCEQALSLNKEIDDRIAEAAILGSLGYAHHQLGQHREAIDCYHRSLDLHRAAGDRHREAYLLSCIGDTHDDAGELELARKVWHEALDILTELEHPEADDVRAKLDSF